MPANTRSWQGCLIFKSPINTDDLFNLRFGLALIVASLLYFWRYSAQKAAFGAKGFDYAEAFALGFAVSLAIDRLADKLADFAFIKGNILIIITESAPWLYEISRYLENGGCLDVAARLAFNYFDTEKRDPSSDYGQLTAVCHAAKSR